MESQAQKEMNEIQKRTFTSWVNLHLKDRILLVRDLFEDLRDGVLLINLIEIISAPRSVGRYNKKPKFIPQKMENVQLALDFLRHEKIKLVNIGSSDIGLLFFPLLLSSPPKFSTLNTTMLAVEGIPKLILGLIWTLILRYHIQKGSNEQQNAKSELLRWVRSKIPQYNINNFSTGGFFFSFFSFFYFYFPTFLATTFGSAFEINLSSVFNFNG